MSIPEIRRAKRQAKKDAELREPYESCGECFNGWIVVGSAVKRCWCWHAHFAKRAAEKATR